MTPASSFKDRKVALFGLGGSGIATANALLAGGADIYCWDDNLAQVTAARDIGIPTKDLRGLDWNEIDALVLAPGVPLTHPRPHWSVALAQEANVEIIGDVELYCRERAILAANSPFIAITGTNGKSTTTALIAHILEQSGREVALGGNIGTAILSLDPPQDELIHVVECSSYQIDLAPSIKPSVGIHLNIAPDHLDRHGDIDHYASVKERLIEGSDCAVIGVDDPHSRSIANRFVDSARPLQTVSVHPETNSDIRLRGTSLVETIDDNDRTIVDLSDIDTLRGAHNAQNAAAAYAACRFVGLARNEIIEGIRSFPGLAHRMEIVGQLENVRFVNDSKATNADAAERALTSFERIYWIAGGRPKTDGIAALTPHFGRITRAYLIGEAAEDFAKTLGNSVAHEKLDNLAQAVSAAARDALSDGHRDVTVLLSPACASWDQFKSFEVRGDQFRNQVQSIISSGGRI